MLKIDLGSGGCKPEGFIGVDRYPMPNVDVVTDLDARLPFESDSVDVIYASHSLEHVRDLMNTMREIHRIAKHGAQVCIVAPYNEQKLNWANPYHICVFNEHTPRFWTHHPETVVDAGEFFHPHASNWGLSMSDHSQPGLDLRLVNMEFFYFPEYLGLPIERLRELRRSRIDVCDQIMYHLIVWKPEQADGRSFDDHVATFQPFVPPYVLERQAKERATVEQLRAQRAAEQAQAANAAHHDEEARKQTLHDMLKALLAQDANARSDATLVELVAAAIDGQQFHEGTRRQRELAETRTELAETQAALASARADATANRQNATLLIQQNHTLLRKLEDSDRLRTLVGTLGAEVDAANNLLSWYRTEQASLQQQLELHGTVNSEQARQFDALQADFQQMTAEHRRIAQDMAALWSENVAQRTSRLRALAIALKPGIDPFAHVAPSFRALAQFVADHYRPSGKSRLELSADLCGIPYQEYRLTGGATAARSLKLAVRALLPPTGGSIGIEIVSGGAILDQVVLPLDRLDLDAPVVFPLGRSLDLGGPWLLRVFARDAGVPVTVYEVIQYGILRRSMRKIPFVELQ